MLATAELQWIFLRLQDLEGLHKQLNDEPMIQLEIVFQRATIPVLYGSNISSWDSVKTRRRLSYCYVDYVHKHQLHNRWKKQSRCTTGCIDGDFENGKFQKSVLKLSRSRLRTDAQTEDQNLRLISVLIAESYLSKGETNFCPPVSLCNHVGRREFSRYRTKLNGSYVSILGYVWRWEAEEIKNFYLLRTNCTWR